MHRGLRGESVQAWIDTAAGLCQGAAEGRMLFKFVNNDTGLLDAEYAYQ